MNNYVFIFQDYLCNFNKYPFSDKPYLFCIFILIHVLLFLKILINKRPLYLFSSVKHKRKKSINQRKVEWISITIDQRQGRKNLAVTNQTV
jgi:hypothetical protein